MSIFGRRIFLVRGLDPRRYLSSSLPTPRKLSEVTDVSKLAQEDTSRIELIWMARHQGLSTACSAIVRQRALVAALLDRAKKSPHFIFPVFNGQNYYFMYSQFQDSHFMMTYLDDFKRDPYGASPWFSVVLYPDLVADKDIALIRGDFLPNIQKKEAEALLSMTLDAYVTDKPNSKHLHDFNHSARDFDLEKYIDMCRSHYCDLFK